MRVSGTGSATSVENGHEVVIRHQKRRVFLKDRLPEKVLCDSRHWDERESEIVWQRTLRQGQTGDPVLIE
ncbi:MAG: hypothetical protein IPL38_09140 [Rhodobacter sp.]|nr:hypothetical protein [Rhodobacter sp.]